MQVDDGPLLWGEYDVKVNNMLAKILEDDSCTPIHPNMPTPNTQDSINNFPTHSFYNQSPTWSNVPIQTSSTLPSNSLSMNKLSDLTKDIPFDLSFLNNSLNGLTDNVDSGFASPGDKSAGGLINEEALLNILREGVESSSKLTLNDFARLNLDDFSSKLTLDDYGAKMDDLMFRPAPDANQNYLLNPNFSNPQFLDASSGLRGDILPLEQLFPNKEDLASFNHLNSSNLNLLNVNGSIFGSSSGPTSPVLPFNPLNTLNQEVSPVFNNMQVGAKDVFSQMIEDLDVRTLLNGDNGQNITGPRQSLSKSGECWSLGGGPQYPPPATNKPKPTPNPSLSKDQSHSTPSSTSASSSPSSSSSSTARTARFPQPPFRPPPHHHPHSHHHPPLLAFPPAPHPPHHFPPAVFPPPPPQGFFPHHPPPPPPHEFLRAPFPFAYPPPPLHIRHSGRNDNIMRLRLDDCYEQFKQIEKERKKTEADLARHNPGKKLSSANNFAVPRLPPNPSRVDRLIVDQRREHARVATLMRKMNQLMGGVIELRHSELIEGVAAWNAAIDRVDMRRREEQLHLQQARGHFVKPEQIDRDTLALADAIRELEKATQRARTCMWCCLKLAIYRNDDDQQLSSSEATNLPATKTEHSSESNEAPDKNY